MFLFSFPKRYSIKNGSASPGADFVVLSSDDVVLQPGETHGGISLMINNDTVPEQNETLSVTVSPSDNVTVLTQSRVNVTIIDDGKNTDFLDASARGSQLN